MLDRKTLRARAADGETFDYLFFWGHRGPKDRSITRTCLSQWYAAAFLVDGVTYPTAEHWMMAEKARLFGDDETLAEILEADDPDRAKGLGRKVRGFEERRWAEARAEIVVRGNVHKFGQSPALLGFLLATKEKVLVEASPLDRVWGIGMAAKDPRCTDPAAWEGLNLLGFALMEARARLAAEAGGA